MVHLTPRSSVSSGAVTPVSPYPGFDQNGTFRNPVPVARLKFQGVDFAAKHRGSIDKWVFKRGDKTFDSPRPVPRCPTAESFENYKHGTCGSIKTLINGEATPRPDSAPCRIKSEGEPIASISRGKRMRKIVHEFGQSAPSPVIPRVKPEAEQTAEVHKGGRMNRLIHSYAQGPLSARPVPRVKPEAEQTASIHTGKRMKPIVHSGLYMNGIISEPAIPRVKPEGSQNAELAKGKRILRLFHDYGQIPLSTRPVPRVKDEGDPNYVLDQGHRMETLMHSGKIMRSPKPDPRVTTPDATRNLNKGRSGKLKYILRETGKKTCVHIPGQQSKLFTKTTTM
ncbi:uncharacterized protein LOC134712699 [Mytilus trossulus]|uniref:uncharacterized protein LOC134712699 n=1 Tax=Mytilus trossulus TaxID=6551 RepID=UPI0030064C73